MKLSDLLANAPLGQIYGSTDVGVTGVIDDSRSVKRGDLFVAIKGLKTDAHAFIPEVIKRGARVVVGEVEPKKGWLKKVTYVKVANSRLALSLFASAWYGQPSRSLKVIGVTGTKGKTTVSHVLYWLLKNSGKSVGLVSSIVAIIGDKEYDTGFHVTNPEPLALQKFLAEMVKAGCEYTVLEVTSHGLDQERVAGINFDIAILTNIAHEHLDYHKTLENYREAKAKLFKTVNAAILNKDDKSFEYLKRILPQTAQLLTYSIKNKSDYKATSLHLNEVMKFRIAIGKKEHKLATNLVGKYNALNILAAIAAARKYSVSWESIIDTLANLQPLPGRLEKFKNNKEINIYIDFAHTPDSLEKVLSLLRIKHKKGKLISVFGCAGERDSLKRPMMAKISTKLADISVFTAEDPRSESVETILSQMAHGVSKSTTKEIKTRHVDELINEYKDSKHLFLRIPERGEAISFAIQKLANKGDTIVICGKGHEKSMAYNEVEYPWSDHEAIKMALNGKVLKIKRPNL